MAGLARADLLVTGVRRPAAHVAGLDRIHALEVVEYGLQTPETASGKSRYFLSCVDHVVSPFFADGVLFCRVEADRITVCRIRSAAKPVAHRFTSPGGIEHESPAQPARRSTLCPRARLLRPANRSRAGGSHICGWLFLVYGTALRRLAGRYLYDLRLHGGNQEKSQLRGSVFGYHRARGGRAGPLRSEEGELRKAPRSVLEERRSYRAGPAVLRHRKPVPHRDLLSHRRAEAPRRSLQKRAREDQTVQGRYRHTRRAGRRVLASRRLSPGFLRQESGEVQVLPNWLRPRCQVEAAVGEHAALTRVTDMRRSRP